ncbi:MAG: 3,4-dehydroadipyl-CoA semialdehyde dehydrogenase, partial [Deltaproteobacteria bacterium]|nr:3,4-dehydroadipyl-CoA semialdehyde dehydrogenase [Deltaproteobacteria bacterium]
TEEPLAETSTDGIDWAAAVSHARDVGGPGLRAMTFAARGKMLEALAKAIHAHRDELLGLGIDNGGNTRGDAKFDVDGAIATLDWYARLGATLGEHVRMVDGEALQLARSPRFVGRHVWVAREGVAVHVNAFNFPAWGLVEKAAVAWLAGAPVVTKPATATALLAHRLVEVLLASGALPEGALTFVAGGVGNLLDHLHGQDVLAFTGSSDTGAKLRSIDAAVARSVRVNVEADSLNAAVLGRDVERGSETWQLFVRDVVRDITQKAGQKCTAIRRVLVPEDLAEAVIEDLGERLSAIRIGNPADPEVRMGPVTSHAQRREVLEGAAAIAREARTVVGDPAARPDGKGYFVHPILFHAKRGHDAPIVHAREVFGPVATVLGYGAPDEAVAMIRRGAGGLVSSIYTDDRAVLEPLLFGIAPFHGRLMLGSAKIAEHSTGPGTVLPALVHGGPGRAGGGEELGSARGLAFYQQRVALQGDRAVLDKVLADLPNAPR